MQPSEKIIEFIKKWESFSDKVYICPAGKPTIGYGHVVEKGKEVFNSPITVNDADRILRADIKNRTGWLNQNMPTLSQPHFDALVSLLFNSTNDGNLERVAPKASSLIKQGKYDEAAKELFSRERGLVFITVKDRMTGERIKQVSNGLVNRRAKEWDIWNGK
jgi:GH24 family phage-related lysozyme (muramidase)